MQQFDSLMTVLKGLKMHLRNPHDKDPIRVKEITIKMPMTIARGPKGKAVTKITTQLEAIKVRLEGEMIETKSNAITTRMGCICHTSALVPKM